MSMSLQGNLAKPTPEAPDMMPLIQSCVDRLVRLVRETPYGEVGITLVIQDGRILRARNFREETQKIS